ncbi:MAG: insulinase family protein, partial [Rhodoferax sp.]|nr:insulinase family protein [Rhodoferax sp.]
MMDHGVRAGGPDEPALDENGLSEAWADLGAELSASASSDRLSFSLRTLTEPDLLRRAVRLAARQLGQPAFDPAILRRELEQSMAALREDRTRPGPVALRAFSRALYGSHPYGAEINEQTLQSIGVADAEAVHRTLLPCRARVTLVGAVDRSQADALVRELLSALPAQAVATPCPALPPVPEVVPLTQASEERIAFASAQAQLLLGQPGIARRDPDYLALFVGNHILGGGGFVSRLTAEVREKRGLSYSVYSAFSPALHAGAFRIGLQTRPDQADQALAVVREVLAQFVEQGPTEEELQAAKANLVGGFALRIDSNRKLLDNVANIAWNDLPLDYLDTWAQQVSRITTGQIRAAFGRVLQPGRMVTVVLGGAAAGAPP